MKCSILLLLLNVILLAGLLPFNRASESAEVNVEGDVKGDVKGGGKGEKGDMKEQGKKNPKKRKNWSSMDFNTIEKEWEAGDDARELEHEFEINRKLQEKKAKTKKSQKEAIQAATKDPFRLNGGSGGTLMFAKLRKQEKKGVDWTNKAIDKIAAKWTTLLRSAAFDVKVVNIGAQGGEDTEQGTLLLSIDKAQNTYDIVKFVLKQKQTDKITLNGKDYTLKDIPKEEED